MTTSTRRFDLRTATSGSHARLEKTVGPLETSAEYRRYVRGLALGRFAFESALARLHWPSAFGAWRPRFIMAELVADLSALGLNPPDALPGRLDPDVSALLGLFYVLEGSALGAAVVYRRAQALGYSSTHGARHLAAQSGTPDNWRSFLIILENAELYDGDRAAASANDVFRSMQAAMEGADVGA